MRHNHPHGPVHSIHSHQHHIGWNNSFPPVAKAAPGDVLEFACLDPSCGQITPDWKAADLARLDFGRINPTLGPIEIDGAETKVLVEQTTVVDPQRLGRSAGRLEADELRAVDEALALVLGL